MRAAFWALALPLLGLWILFHQQELARRNAACLALNGRRVTLTGDPIEAQGDGFVLHSPQRVLVRGDSPDWRFQVRVTGRWTCRLAVRNPGVVADGRWGWTAARASVRGSVERLDIPVGWRSRARSRMGEVIRKRLSATPGIRALALSVWLGDTSELPPYWLTFYRESGLLHVLALSGQHIALLLLLAQVPLLIFALRGVRSYFYRRYFQMLSLLSAGICATFLWWINPENAPLERAVVMWIAWQILRARKMKVSGVQVVATCAAMMLLWDLENIASDSFLLSAVATFWLVVLIQGGGTPVAVYLRLATLIPLCLTPLVAFLFAKFAAAAALNGILVAWTWSVLWIPLGFISPALPRWANQGFEGLWDCASALQQGAAGLLTAGYETAVRPTWSEALIAQGWVWILWLAVTRHPLIFARKTGEIEE